MRILVTGATGFVAAHLIPELQKRGHIVRGLVLPSGETTWLDGRGAEVVRGDVRDTSSLVPAMSGVDAVFHLAAAIGTKRPLGEYQAVNVTGTENVCHGALAAGVKRLIHVSTTSVYEQGLGEPVSEDYPLRPLPDPYPVTKAEGDLLVQRMIAEQGLPACIIRTSTVFGPGDHLNFGRIADRLQAGKAIIVGTGRNAVPFVYVTDVVRALLLALDRDEAAGQVYNITDDDCPTQEELLTAIAAELGVKPPRIRIPYSVLYGAGYVAERIAALTHSPHPLVTRFGVALYGADNRCSIEKARRELGFEPQVPLREGIRRTAAWYLENSAASRRLSPMAAA